MPESTSMSSSLARPNETPQLRRPAWLPLLAIVALALFSARVCRVTAPTGDSAMLSANDRSRWCTVRALVEHGTYRIDGIIRERDRESGRRIWSTIDRVRHRGWDGREHDYSSKPPLYPTLLAAEYWVIRQLTGMTLADDPFTPVRLIVWLTNGSLLLAFWWAIARWLKLWSDDEWSSAVVFAMAAFGTFLTTFAVTINNHLPAAVTCAWTADALIRLGQGERQGWRFALASGMAALTAANELPALSLLAAVLVYLAWIDWRRTLMFATPAVMLTAALFFGTNYAAHGSWRPPYAHRGEGKKVATFESSRVSRLRESIVGDDWRRELERLGIRLGKRARWEKMGKPDRWALFDLESGRRWAVRVESGRLVLYEWDDWYDYAGSYWRPGKRQGVDRGEPSRARYAFHVLIGHHGIMSLTPFWLLTLYGCWQWGRHGDSVQKSLVMLTVALSLVCVAFFLTRPQIDRNYGGMTSGFRWLFWLIPLWLGTTIPATLRLGTRRPGRGLVYGLLGASVFAAAYPAMQPWSHPWLYDWWVALGGG